MATVEETPAIPTSDGDPQIKLSKNQQRKQKRYAKIVERRVTKRKEEKEKLKQRRRDKKNIGEDPSVIPRSICKRNRMADSSCRIRICIDCRYDSMMTEKDVGSLQKQIAFSYASNRRLTTPCQLYLTNVDGQLEPRLASNGAKNWDVFLHSEPLEKVFSHEDILYLTSESENVLSSTEPLDERTVYVIGGLVDHNSRKGLCHQLAVQNQWRHARLPIDEFIKLNTRRVLACNHVLEILLNYIQLGDWKNAFEENIPKRKLTLGTDIDDDVPKLASPDHPGEAKVCAEIHDRRKEVEELETPLVSPDDPLPE